MVCNNSKCSGYVYQKCVKIFINSHIKKWYLINPDILICSFYKNVCNYHFIKTICNENIKIINSLLSMDKKKYNRLGYCNYGKIEYAQINNVCDEDE